MIGTACKYLTGFITMIFLTIIAAEHHVLYQYNLVGASNHYMGLIQTETVSYLSSTPIL